MLKKIFSTLAVMICFICISWADYQPIFKNRQYEIEINDTINKTIPVTKHSIKKIVKEVKNEKNEYYKQVLIEQGIASDLFEFYKNLADITEKYIPIGKNIPATNWYEEIKEQLDPYLKNNNINTKKIDKLINYAKKKQFQLEKKYRDN